VAVEAEGPLPETQHGLEVNQYEVCCSD